MNMVFRASLVLGLLALTGCQAPWIKVPTLFPGDPAAERASYTINDPLPDNSLGPNPGGLRPREAGTQRSEPRRTMEAAVLSHTSPQYIPGSGPGPQLMPPPASTYPNTISP